MKQIDAGVCDSRHSIVRDFTGLVHVMGSESGTPFYQTMEFPCSLRHGHAGDHRYIRGSFVIVRWDNEE